MDKVQKRSLESLAFNVVFSVYYFAVGVTSMSWWLLTLGVYYFVLSAARFFVLKTKKDPLFAERFAGVMLMILSVPLVAMVVMAVWRDRGNQHHMIVMIAMAAYAFTKVTLAIVQYFKARRHTSSKLLALRNISLAHALVSIFALQRSMLVSFEGMNAGEIRVMNGVLGSVVCIAVFLLGLGLYKNKKAEA